MLNEYILDQLKILESEKEELSRQLDDIIQQETDCEERMRELDRTEDVSLEIFSPRAHGTEKGAELADMQKHIDELRYQEAEIRAKIERNETQEEKYQKLLLEARMNTEVPTSDVSREELEHIAASIDQCIGYLRTDRAKCKAELKNMRYYVKALLSRGQDAAAAE